MSKAYEKGVKACKKKFETERTRLKAITLGVLYGKTVYTVASECGITTREAALLLQRISATSRSFGSGFRGW